MPQKKTPNTSHDIALDSEGNVLPYVGEEVRAITNKARDEGRLLAAIFEMPSGDVAVQVMGPPSHKVLEALETTVRSYRRALRGH